MRGARWLGLGGSDGWQFVPHRLYLGGGDYVDVMPGRQVLRVREGDSEAVYVGSKAQIDELRKKLRTDG